MFEYLGLAYRNSDYTAVITIMHWPECKTLVLKLTLVVEIWAWGVFRGVERHMKIQTTRPWSLSFTDAITHRAGSYELQYLACATSELQPIASAATRSAVAPRYTPGRGKIVPRNII